LAASSQDRHIRVYHLESGELISNVNGHSELVTGLKFSSDCSHLISISGTMETLKKFFGSDLTLNFIGDGCIFLWRWPDDFSESLRASAAAIKPARATRVLADPRAVLNNTSTLPVWARKALGENIENITDNTAVHPSGEWAKVI
jgi:WD40 repeat protein